MTLPHTPVLLDEVLEAFKSKHLHTFIDGTLGSGGHAEGILQAHPEIERFIGIDQDPTALEIARQRLMPWLYKLKLIHSNFSDLITIAKDSNVARVDGILLDLGVSSMQLDQPEKGFSFMRDGPLDMRMNPLGHLTAADVVNNWSEEDLGKVFREYGEEKQWRAAAQQIVKTRAAGPLLTTHALADALRPIFFWKKKGFNPLTLIFQALRICVNRELEVIEQVIPKAIDLLSPGGRLAIISFHSLEDRIVKNHFRQAASDKENTEGLGGLFLDKTPIIEIVYRKPICASSNEVENNLRSRSAKLRVAEKK